MKKFYISSGDFDTSVAIVDDGKLINFFTERVISAKTGNIYKGRVEKVVSNMNFVFVDIGDERPAFLSERGYFDTTGADFADVAEDNEDLKPQDMASGMFEKGQEILVQVSKEPYSTKGARLTTNIMIPGYYTVFSPYMRAVGISKRITEEAERERLRNEIISIKQELPGDYGIIARTQATGAGREELKKEIAAALEEWKRIKIKADDSRAPVLLRAEQSLPLKILRENLDAETSEIVTDNKQIYDDIKAYLNETHHRSIDLNFYDGYEQMFDYYGFQNQVDGMFNNIVAFKKGGYIKIDITEALTVFDINSGKFKGVEDVENSITTININAAKEICRQIILRNIGGLIVVDFIDMKNEDNKKKVKEVMEQELSKSKAYFKCADISEFGLMEITRKRDAKRIDDMFFEECPKCNGHGRILTEEYVCIKYMKKIRHECMKTLEENVSVTMPERIKEKINSEYIEKLHEYEIKYKKNIIIKTEG